MSFSSTVKNELCRIETIEECCLNAELAAVLRISGTIGVGNGATSGIRVITENAAFARRVFSFIKKICNIYPEVIIKKSSKLKKHATYVLVLANSKVTGLVLRETALVSDSTEPDTFSVLKKLLKRNCCRKSFLRGAFLAGGSISDPEKTYHFEITVEEYRLAVFINEIIKGYKLKSKVIKRKGNYVVYLKEGENIVDLLNIMGAHTALMELENVRILKEMRNNVNRIVNCETANLDKTVNAAIRQIENIEYIRDKIGFNKLPENLREIAELRLEFREANLKELGEMLTPPLGKSGVNHRLNKLDKIANSARELKGEY